MNSVIELKSESAKPQRVFGDETKAVNLSREVEPASEVTRSASPPPDSGERELAENSPGGRRAGGAGLSATQLERTLAFIESAPFREICLASMAKAAGLSPFHFSRMFKLSTGRSPHQFVLHRRLEIGADRLANSTTPISEIASELGFADQSHFTMHFKRQHGVAPAAFRRQRRS